MLGISLILVGIVLVHNGVLFLSKTKKQVVDKVTGETSVVLVPLIADNPKTIAFFNAIVGGILVLLNLISLAFFAPADLAIGAMPSYLIFQNIAAGMIFGVTYLFIAGNFLFKLDLRAFGWFGLGAAIFAFAMVNYNAVMFFRVGFTYGYSLLILAILWLTWFVLWITAPLEFIFKIKPMSKIFPWVSITIGIIGAFIPALLLLTGIWGLL